MSLQLDDDRLSQDHSRIGPLAGIQYAADLAGGVRSGSSHQRRRAAVMLAAFALWVVLPLVIMGLIAVGVIP